MSRHDVERAFPAFWPANEPGSFDHGMTLRDYFAAHAPPMPSAFRDIWISENLGKSWLEQDLLPADVLRMQIAWRWDYATDMLAAREKGE